MSDGRDYWAMPRGADLWVKLQSEDPSAPHEEEELPGDDILSLPDGSFRWIKGAA